MNKELRFTVELLKNSKRKETRGDTNEGTQWPCGERCWLAGAQETRNSGPPCRPGIHEYAHMWMFITPSSPPCLLTRDLSWKKKKKWCSLHTDMKWQPGYILYRKKKRSVHREHTVFHLLGKEEEKSKNKSLYLLHKAALEGQMKILEEPTGNDSDGPRGDRERLGKEHDFSDFCYRFILEPCEYICYSKILFKQVSL